MRRVVKIGRTDLDALLRSLLHDPRRESGIPLCHIVPVRWRQILRAAFARFFRSRIHVSIVLADILLILCEPIDHFGILSVPWIRAALVLLLIYEAVYFLADILYHMAFYRTYFYDIREQSIVIRSGVLCKHELTLPLKSITDVYLDQDFFGRLLGLCDLHVSSPTNTSGRFAHMLGIDRLGAQSLRLALLESIQRQKVMALSRA